MEVESRIFSLVNVIECNSQWLGINAIADVMMWRNSSNDSIFFLVPPDILLVAGRLENRFNFIFPLETSYGLNQADTLVVFIEMPKIETTATGNGQDAAYDVFIASWIARGQRIQEKNRRW